MQRRSSLPPRAAVRPRDSLAQMLGATLMTLCVLPVSAAIWSLALWIA